MHSAEPKNETTARIDWKSISGAEEYVVVYSPKDGGGQEKIFTTTAANAKLTGLTPGAIYQYKIRCKCSGKFSIDSELGEFDLSKSEKGNKDCDSISNLKIKQITETEIQLSWPYPQPVKPGSKTQTSYKIRYKENGQVWSQSYPIDLVVTSELQADYTAQGEVKKTIDKLSSGVRYDIEVKAYCGTEDAIANEPFSGTTKEVKEADCSQGGSCDRTSKRPLEGLKVGDTIGVSDYKMKIITLSPDTRGAYLWKGTGVAATPLIGKTDNVRFNIDFDSLYVNDKVCVTAGNLKAGIGAQLFDNETTAKIRGLVDDFGTALNDAQKASKDAAKLIDDAQKAGEDALNYFQGGDDVGFVKTGGLGGISTEAENFNDLEVEGNSIKVGGKSYPVERFPTLVKDSNGNVISVSSNGTKTEVGHYDESLKGLQDAPTSSKAKVIFKANSNATYSFDAWQDGYGKSVAMAPHYLNIDGKYYSAKAITPGAVDKVDFDFSGGDKSKLVFVNREGFVFKTLSNSTLQLAGGPAKDGQEILAIYDNGSKKEIAGALLLASYHIVEKKVKLVTLAMGNNFNKDINAIQAQLNKAYNPIGINYTVEVDNSFDSNRDWCDKGNCDFNTGGSGLLNNDYTGVEARVIDAYINFKGEDKLEATTAYMFVIGMSKAEQGDEALQGKMNFSKQFGFLYSAASQNPKTLGRTLAHELGHGNYKLYHIFDPMYLGDAARNSDNLMSYNTNVNALALNKLQWDVAHDPGVTWGVFKRDNDQKFSLPCLGIMDDCDDVIKILEAIRAARIAHQPFKIPNNAGTSVSSKAGTSLEINGTSFDKIIVKVESKLDVNVSVSSFQNITIEYLNALGKIENEYGIAFRDENGSTVIKILIEDKSSDISGKRERLRKYLCEDNNLVAVLMDIRNTSINKLGSTNMLPLKDISMVERNVKLGTTTFNYLKGYFSSEKNQETYLLVNPVSYYEKSYGFEIILNKTDRFILELSSEASPENFSKEKQYLKDWLFNPKIVPEASYPKYPITKEQLKEIFKDEKTDDERLEEVVVAINKYSNKFNLDTKIEMCHFIGQIGAETGGLQKLDESVSYTPKRVVEVFGLKKYAHLFQGYNSDGTCTGVTYLQDGLTNGNGKAANISPVFPYSTKENIIAAYASPTVPEMKDGKINNVNSNYNSGIIRVKNDYHGSDAKLFNVTYACRLGNRGVNSEDGMKFKGKGFVHLTGRYNYKLISDTWNADPENALNKKSFHISSSDGGNLEELESNVDVAIKASLYYWELNNVNDWTGASISDEKIRQVSSLVNTGNTTTAWNDINGIATRKKFTDKANQIFP
ncbi:hypothetical protein CHU_3448 [Sporocytophaga myxococcoides]|uniref:Fibronectin type-III domain-containing protein n=1 Tax=Sporocytophaga myxococcoides TaxID=153721 RepID=A0A098LI85_9BACT|nr:fibronectin type III domain-containing protein [Sporocytophaga myxococcoides]GAL86189.1 hypothetical protein CHU_3448 [Sporocytophaga myxococcoides]